MKQDEHSTARPTLKRWGKRSPIVEPRWARPKTSHHAPTKAGAIIKSEARPAGVQLKRGAKLLTVIGLAIKHAVCRIIFMLYPVIL